MKKIIRTLIVILIVYIVIGTSFGIRTVSKAYEVKSEKINSEINVVQISDFHSLEKYDEVIYITKQDVPDVIVLTGDILTNTKTEKSTLKFIKELIDIAPVYYVNGNNDNPGGIYKKFKEEMIKIGVTVLENEYVDIKINDQEIRIIGTLDNSYATILSDNKKNADEITETLTALVDDSKYNLVLSHRPQYFDEFVNSGADLVLTGHTHGGMIRVPIINKGSVLPDQKLFGEYDYGLYEKDGTTMIINSGTTTKNYVPRLYNPKEVVKVTIKPE